MGDTVDARPQALRRRPMLAMTSEGTPASTAGVSAAPSPQQQPDSGPWLLCTWMETETAWEGGSAEDRGPKPSAQIVKAIAFVRARILLDSRGGLEGYDVVECRAGGRPGADERALVAGFWSSFEAWKPHLVTFNGRGHLLPVLRFASMRHCLQAKWLHEAGDRWNGYAVRFSTAFHTDVMDQLSDHHASPFSSLAEAARSIGLPEPGGAGDGDLRGRAEKNAAVLFNLFLRWQLYCGKLTRAGHDASIQSLTKTLGARPPE